MILSFQVIRRNKTMIIINNFYYFENSDKISDIRKVFKELLKSEKETDCHSSSSDEESLSSVIKDINNLKFRHLSQEEKTVIKKLFMKENKCRIEKRKNICEQRFYFYFALLDYIVRNKLKHDLHWDIRNHSNGIQTFFLGKFSEELNSMETICEEPFFNFTLDIEKPIIPWDINWEKTSLAISNVFLPIEMKKEYDKFSQKYKKNIREYVFN